MTRHVWQIDPMSGLSDEEVIGLIGPTTQRYLSGRLPGAAPLTAAGDIAGYWS